MGDEEPIVDPGARSRRHARPAAIGGGPRSGHEVVLLHDLLHPLIVGIGLLMRARADEPAARFEQVHEPEETGARAAEQIGDVAFLNIVDHVAAPFLAVEGDAANERNDVGRDAGELILHDGMLTLPHQAAFGRVCDRLPGAVVKGLIRIEAIGGDDAVALRTDDVDRIGIVVGQAHIGKQGLQPGKLVIFDLCLCVHVTIGRLIDAELYNGTVDVLEHLFDERLGIAQQLRIVFERDLMQHIEEECAQK